MSSDSTVDAIAQINLLTTGLTSSNASANLITVTNQALALSTQNSVANQQQGYITHQSASVQGRNSMFATSITAMSEIVKDIDDS